MCYEGCFLENSLNFKGEKGKKILGGGYRGFELKFNFYLLKKSS